MPAATGAESISIAIDSATPHFYEPGTRIPMESALKSGATPAGIIAVMTLTSWVHTMALGVGLRSRN